MVNPALSLELSIPGAEGQVVEKKEDMNSTMQVVPNEIGELMTINNNAQQILDATVKSTKQKKGQEALLKLSSG